MRERIAHNANLHADGLLRHEISKMLDLLARQRHALLVFGGRQQGLAHKAIAQETLDFEAGNQVHHRGPAPQEGFLALLQNAQNGPHILKQTGAIGEFGRDALDEQLLQHGLEIGGGEQEGNRPRQHDDMLRLFLDLPQPFEISHSRRDELDADAKKRGNGDAQQFGELVQRLDLGEFAALEAVERRARDADPPGDLIGAQPRGDAEGLQSVADFIIAKAHGAIASAVAKGGINKMRPVAARSSTRRRPSWKSLRGSSVGSGMVRRPVSKSENTSR